MIAGTAMKLADSKEVSRYYRILRTSLSRRSNLMSNLLQCACCWDEKRVGFSPQSMPTRIARYRRIQHYRATIQQPWLFAGNFNETASLEERNHGGIEMLRHCEKFKNWIENNGFIDMVKPLKNVHDLTEHCAMWSSRLDSKKDQGSISFRTILIICRFLISTLAWTTPEGFDKVLQEHWLNNTALVPALQTLEVFGNLFRRKRKLWARIPGIQTKLNQGRNPYLRKLETRLKGQLRTVLDQIEIFWMQKSRVEAIQDGDYNTRYFHMNIRHKFNRIEVLQNDEGDWVTDSEQVNHMTYQSVVERVDRHLARWKSKCLSLTG
ncbi:hypothetical protein Cgig2_002711 [Carnegiea gigantea]|uniref:Uncharacterized protein n=1 Tax=Carnegiea gigantea TaxID=171969 RepID=A0A9Q1GKQ6_9CARY|nr:hypothetical protein Cgig2_002711 [Carnegiea gigantea]